MKKVLVVHYSQTGQLSRVLQAFCAPLRQSENVELTECRLKPARSYPFPWPFFAFFDQFPETVSLDPPAVDMPGLNPDDDFDLVILGYTVWFLSPSPPTTAFLKSDTGQALINNKPVITLIACRNMWLMAQEITRRLIGEAGGRLIDNVALVDKGSSLTTFVTTPRWMLTGKTDRLWNLFPRPGIREEDIAAAGRFGRAIVHSFESGEFDGHNPVLQGLGAVDVDERLIASEKMGRRSFVIWGSLLRFCGPPGAPQRLPILAIYAVFLTTAIATVVPLSMLVRALLRPLLRERLQRQRYYYEQPSGSSEERLEQFL